MIKIIKIFILCLSCIACDKTKTIELSGGLDEKLINAAIDRTKTKVTYNGKYLKIPYPNGDVPDSIGVCTDLIIRSYRAINVDLQKLVHEDISKNFNVYPLKKIWKANRSDRNIDHRRVPNLQKFFERKGAKLPITKVGKDYLPGDIVTWDIPGNSPWHIGIVSNTIKNDTPLIIHNMGRGPVVSDILFKFKITGHYRYFPS
tara:strand:+ start:8074 stop:8679 length:606 start_codon:yes stop_codon:yes gene_type:complete